MQILDRTSEKISISKQKALWAGVRSYTVLNVPQNMSANPS